jgi:prevent-host-death family protein
MTRREILINVHEAKSHLSRLLERVVNGEEIVIGKAGKPVAKLVPYHESQAPRSPGDWQGRVRIAPDFDELPLEVAAVFRGDSE